MSLRNHLMGGLLVALLAVAISPPVTLAWAETAQTEVTDERSTSFDRDWQFDVWLNAGKNKRTYDQDDAALAATDYDDSSWRTLDLPHDWSIEQEFTADVSSWNGALPSGVGWYRKSFTLPADYAGKRISIEFDGVFQDSSLYVNGTLVGGNPYGYGSFARDITDYVTADGSTKNVIAVKVNSTATNGSRWYTGSGIYRHVRLTTTEPVHVAHWGTAIYSPDIAEKQGKGDLTLNNRVTVKNQGDAAASVQVRTSLLAYGSDKDAGIAKPGTTDAIEIAAGEKKDIEGSITVSNPKLWSVDDPNLYTVKTEILVNGDVVDTYTDRFGFKWSEFTTDDGFFLNGEHIKIQGVCMHHDQGALGAAAYEDSIYRQMRIMKEMGVNAIRTSHNPADPALIKACDELGLMVNEEAYDGWKAQKSGGEAYSAKFDDPSTDPDADGMTWGEFNYASMIRKDRNHPSIISWSIGNEVYDNWKIGADWAINWVDNAANTITPREDPARRPATVGDNQMKYEIDKKVDGQSNIEMEKKANIQGFNYSEENYDILHERFPTWKMYGSETASAITSRGWYSDPEKALGAQYIEGVNLSSYDNSAVEWGRTAQDSLIPDRDRKYIAGQYVWTGFDYIGEPTPFGSNAGDPQSSYFGIVDTAGFAKDSYYLYQSQWLSVDEHPMVHILPHWNWQDDDLRALVDADNDGKIPVRAYSNAPSVELFKVSADGAEESLGRKDFYQIDGYFKTNQQESKDSENLYQEWQVAWKYEPGTKLVCKAYAGTDKNAEIIATDEVVTAGEAAGVQLKAEENYVSSSSESLSFIEADIVDKDGNFVPTGDNEITFSISGDGEIVGVDNGDSASWENYKDTNGTWKRKAYSGKALVIVKSTGKNGRFTVTATADGLSSGMSQVFTTDKDVTGDTIVGYEDASVTVDKGTKAADVELPKSIQAVLGSGDKVPVRVTWDELKDSELSKAGTFDVSGAIEGTDRKATLHVTVRALLGVRDISLVTVKGTVPELPETVDVMYSDGSVDTADVTWDTVAKDQYAKEGRFSVKGSVKGHDGLDAKANVRVLASPYDFSNPQRLSGMTVTSSSDNVSDADKLVDGNPWSYYVVNGGEGVSTIKLAQKSAVCMIEVDGWTDNTMAAVESLKLEYKNEDGTWSEVANAKLTDYNGTPITGTLYTYENNRLTFDPVVTGELRLTLGRSDNTTFGVGELYVKAGAEYFGGTEAKLADLQLDGATIEGFGSEVYTYDVALPWNVESAPKVTAAATDENASVFVRQAVSPDSVAVVEVRSEDGNTTNKYTISFKRSVAPVAAVAITSDVSDVTADDTVELAYEAKDGNGTVMASDKVTAEWSVTDAGGHAEIKGGKLLAYDPGKIELSVKVTAKADGSSVTSDTLTIDIKENPANKTFDHFDEVSVKTVPGAAPKLPDTVIANYSTGLPRALKVTWDAIDPAQYAQVAHFTVKGTVEGLDEQATATVDVVAPIAAQNISTVVPQGYEPTLPATVTVYNSDGTTFEAPVSWDKGSLNDEGTVKTYTGSVQLDEETGTAELKVTATVRIASADEVAASSNYAIKFNGFGLPDGLASFSNENNGDKATYLNDGTRDAISGTAGAGKKIWCNWSSDWRAQDWVGVPMATSGLIKADTVDQAVLSIVDEGYTNGGIQVPAGYKVQYYKEDAPDFYEMLKPNYNSSTGIKDGGSMADESKWPNNPLNDDANWADVEYVDEAGEASEALALPARPNGAGVVTLTANFKPVKTRMIRVVLDARQGACLGVSELEYFGKMVKTESLQKSVEGAQITANGEDILSKFDENGTMTVKLKADEAYPELAASAANNTAVTVVPATDSNPVATITFVPEAGGASARTYTIVYEREGQEPVPVVHTVTFESNGGSQVTSVQVEDGVAVSKPADPTKTGYAFAGWYSDEDLTKAYDFASPVTGAITLYAKWTTEAPEPAVKHMVTFAANGGSDVKAVEVEDGQAIAAPTAPTRDGFTFAGWYADEALTKAYDFSTPVTADLTLYAKWAENGNPGENPGQNPGQNPGGNGGQYADGNQGDGQTGQQNGSGSAGPAKGTGGSMPRTGDSALAAVCLAAAAGALCIVAGIAVAIRKRMRA